MRRYIKELGLADAEIVALDYANGEHKSQKYTEVLLIRPSDPPRMQTMMYKASFCEV